MIKYKFYCTFLGVQTEVFPINFKSGTKFIWEKVDEQIFSRKKLDGTLLFKNTPVDNITDFTYFYNIDQGADRCEEISFLVKRSCDNGATYVDYWNGYFSINDGIFEPDSCIFSVKVSPDDKYRCYLENSENEYNIKDVPNPITTNYSVTDDYEFYTCRDTEGNCDPGLPEPAATWLVFHTEVLDGVTTTIYYREIQITACQGGVAAEPTGGWTQVESYGNCDNGFAKWARIPVDVVTNNPNPDVSAGNCTDDGSGGYIPTPPPKKVSLTVTKQNSTPTPVIVGPDQIDFGGCSAGVIWRVRDNPGSTYAWTITGAGNVINSGAATSEVDCDLSNAGSIKVVETTACGASAEAVLNFISDASDRIANEIIIQRTRVCAGSVSRIIVNWKQNSPLTLNLNDIGSTGSSLLNIDTTTWEFTAGPNTGQVAFFWSGGACLDTTLPAPSNIIVGKNIRTPDIDGLSTVCKSGTYKYRVPPLDVATYTWAVTGGSIISGQGTSEITVTWDGNTGDGTVELLETGCDCGWILIQSLDAVDPCLNGGPSYWWCPDVDQVEVTKTKLLRDILDYMATQMCGCHSCETGGFDSIISDFFNINPVGDSPGYVAGLNYVTNEVQKLTYLSMAPKEILLDPTSEAKKGILTWESITKFLRDMFQVYWFVDDNNNVRFEHFIWFQRTVAFDLTSAQYLRYKSRTKYSYDKIKMPKYERFRCMEASNTDFVGAEIRYDSVCVNPDPKSNVNKINVDTVTTDLAFIAQSPDDIDSDGFVMMVNDYNGTSYSVSLDIGKITGMLMVNAHLSWANLHYSYYRYNRVLSEGYMNLALTNFLSTKRFKRQEDVKFPFCCGDELETLEDLITTSLGNGVVDSAELTNADNMIKLTLLYQ